MSLLDLVLGNWTWAQLLREIAPLILVGASAFFAGLMTGQRKGLDEAERLLLATKERP